MELYKLSNFTNFMNFMEKKATKTPRRNANTKLKTKKTLFGLTSSDEPKNQCSWRKKIFAVWTANWRWVRKILANKRQFYVRSARSLDFFANFLCQDKKLVGFGATPQEPMDNAQRIIKMKWEVRSEEVKSYKVKSWK